MVADRINQIGISPTLKISNRARAMKSEGIDVIDFSAGEPDFATPQNIKDAAKTAIDRNFTKYTANEGIPELREAIARRLREDHGLAYEPGDIIVSNGAKQSIYNVILALVDEGEEVIIPAPYWVSYPEMVSLAKGKPVIVRTKEENGFKLTPQQLREAVSGSTKALILNNPSNPTGAAYTRSELEELANVIVGEDLYVIADEIYEKIIYDDYRFVSFATLGEQVKKKTIVINGVSKAYSMTGWRIGYAAGPHEIIDGANKVQSHTTSNASTISQYASLEAFTGPQYEISKMRAEFEKRRNFVLYKLGTIQGLSCRKPEGAFYVFPNVSAFYGKEYQGTSVRNSYGMAYYLLREAKVAVVPGDAFGNDDYIRVSYATSMEDIEKGMARIVEAVAKLKTPAKVKYVSLNNSITRVRKPVPVDSSFSVEKRDALVAEAEAYIKHDSYFEWNANINGVVVQLRTNVPHLYDFWVENWYPAQLETDLEPHGIVYAVDGAVGREPHAFYNSETKTGVLFNTDYYGSLRSLALGLVTDVGERLFDVHSIRGMSADHEGIGFVLMGPQGTNKTELFYGLLQKEGVALHSNDILFVRYGGGYAAADNPERKVFTPTNSEEVFTQLAQLFDRSKCENVVTRKEECTNSKCRNGEACDLDKGASYCYRASKESYAMLDPYWIGGMRKHVKRIDLRAVFLLRNDPVSDRCVRLQPEDAISMLESGFASGAQHSDTSRSQPFYNPHLLVTTTERMELQKRSYAKLFKVARCFSLNTGAGSLEEVSSRLIEALTKEV